jgi:glycosyltransferase involved in cell wall biosynthesis
VVEDVASWLGQRLDKPIMMVLHGGELPVQMARRPNWFRRVLGRADALVAPSEYNARAAASCGFQAQVIPNVIDLSLYPYRVRRELRPRLFWMRTFHRLYNPELALRVVARLRSAVPDVTLVMAGQDKGLGGKIRERAQKLDLQDAVRFAGFLDMAGKTREANAADIFLNTNRVDNMPVSVVEACAMGLPVVATAVGGVPDLLVDGDTGLLVPTEDLDAMVGAIHRLLNEPDLAERLSRNARRLAERSSWEQVRPLWECVFADVMARRACVPSGRR